MNTTTFPLVFLILLGVTVLFCEGRIGGVTERCLCQGTKLKEKIKKELVVSGHIFHPSASCSNTEIVVTLKKGRKLCLNPNGIQGKRILSGQKPKRKDKTQGRKKQKKNKQQG